MRGSISALGLLMLTPSAHAQSSAVPAAGVGQMLFGLAAVLALVFGLAWIARRLGVSAAGHSPLLRQISALSVGTRERVVIVEAGESWLVLGITAQTIRTLHTLPKGEIPEAPANALTNSFAALLNKARNPHAPR